MNTVSTISFQDLRAGLGRTSGGPISLSDVYNVDATAPGAGPIHVSNVLGTKTQGDMYQAFHPSTQASIVGMYSTRLTNSNYIGPVIQIKRSSDNAVFDVYSDLSGNLKDKSFTTSYASWIGNNVGYVTKWYDQSGAGVHATNSASPVIPPRLVLDPTGSGRYVVFFPNSKVPDPDLKIQLSFNSTFPSYNSVGGSAPTFDFTSQSDNWVKFNPGAVTSSSATCQYFNFGPQTFNLGTVGFSFTCQFQFIGSPNSYERLLHLGNSANAGSLIISRAAGTGAGIIFQYIDVSGTNLLTFQPSSTISQNTTYKIAFVYNPNVGATGTAYFYLNGSNVASSSPSTKLPNVLSVTNTWVGKSLYGSDGALNAYIYSLKVYDRVLSVGEVAADDEYGNNYPGLMISPQNVASVMCSFYPVMTLNTFHTLVAQAGVDLSLRFWANPNLVASGPWPVGSANNPTYVLYNENTGDFMNSSSGGYAFFNDVHDNSSPYLAFSGGSWNTMSFSRNSGTIPITYIGQHGNGTQSRSFYGYMGDLILFNSTIPVNAIGEGTVSQDYRMFAKRSLGGCKWTDGLIGRYTSDSWNGSVWQDTSGANNHATAVTNPGSIIKSGQFVSGGVTCKITFPTTLLASSNYTLFHVSKYNGANKKRILTAAWTDPDLRLEVGFLSTTSGWTSTGGTAPSWVAGTTESCVRFSSGNVLGNSVACQHLNFGAKTFNVGTKGFSATCRFRFTGGTALNWERIFDFGNGSANDNILCGRMMNTNNMRFQIFNGASFITCDVTYTFNQNTTYNIVVVYDPNVTSTGSMYFYVNGTLQQTTSAPAFKAADRTVTYSYVGKSLWSDLDYALNGDIYSLKVYNRVLSAAEISDASQYPYTNWLSGHYNGLAGYAYHANTQLSNAVDRHGTNWVISTDQHTLYRSLAANRVVNTPENLLSYPVTMTINGNTSEASDWAVACILAFNRKLSLAECLMVEDSLASRYSIPIPIQEGLTCSLDAADYDAGTDGSTWRDRTRNGYNFTLTNTGVFSGGAMVFNGSNNAIRTTIALPSSPVYVTAVIFVQTISSTTDYRTFFRGASVHHALTNVGTHNLGYWNVVFIPYDNDVKVNFLSGAFTRTNMLVFQYSTTAPYVKFFYNPVAGPLYPTGVIQSNTSAQITEGVSTVSHLTQGCGSVSGFLLYNRALAEDEMTDMYNRYAPRFNLPTDKTYHSIYSPFMWFRARDLSATLAHGAAVSSWTSSGPVWAHVATGSAAGTGTVPTLDKNSESAPFVRLGTNTDSNTNGGYFDCGSKTFNLLNHGGFTVIAHVRFRSAANKERVFDFGSTLNGVNDNIMLYRSNVSNQLNAAYAQGSNVLQNLSNTTSDIAAGSWQTVAMRVTDTTLTSFYGTIKNQLTQTLSLTNRTFAYTFIGKSCSSSTDSYANIDIRDFIVYDRPLDDYLIAFVRSFLENSTKIPPSIKTMPGNAGVVTSGLQLWLDMRMPASYDPSRNAAKLYDLSGNSNDFTLNGSGYSFAKEGFLKLSATSTTYGVGPSGDKFNITIDHTVEFLVHTRSAHANQIFRITAGVAVEAFSEMIGIYMLHSTGKIHYHALSTRSPEVDLTYVPTKTNSLKHVVARCRTTNGTTYIELFENNVLMAGPTPISPQAGIPWSGVTRLFSAENNSVNFKNAYFYYMRLYNRALSDSELAQNYVASGGLLTRDYAI